MTRLARRLARRIALDGPISVAEYMVQSLLDPEDGYYTTRDPLGTTGDFTTAPEISQMFGELIGLALAQAWLDRGRPAEFALVELGPGRGTLMQDALRAVSAVPSFAAALASPDMRARLHLVERSPVLRDEQARRVSGVAAGRIAPVWHDDVTTLPDDVPFFAVANEFFDALPIRQFRRDADAWREVMVTVRDEEPPGDASPPALTFALGPPAPLAALEHRLGDTTPGDVVEMSPGLPAIVGEVARRLALSGGCQLIFDYGGWRSRGDTLQAVQAHAYADPLAAPGTADLTAHVDFEAIARAARAAGAQAWGPVGQGAWLGALGIAQRAEALARAIDDPETRETHLAGYRRLTAPDGMGTLFQVMALTQEGAAVPAGFCEPAARTG